MSKRLLKFVPPKWAAKLSNVPKHRIQLANLETPIHEWHLPGVPKAVTLSIKRDDMTGSSLSGNKVRKLEFLLAEAVSRNSRHVLTCGSIQSNHCRAAAVAARELGLQAHLFLRTPLTEADKLGVQGNLLVDRLSDAQVYLIPKSSRYETDILPKMKQLARHIRQEHGEESYLVPVGGSNEVGLFGYITAFEEMINQNILDNFDDIVVACGSGGTIAGLCIGNYLTGSKLRCHAICVCDDASYFYQHIDEMLIAVGLTDIKSRDIVDIIEGHKGQGYGISTSVELDFLKSVASTTGIVLDPVYTVKAVKGLVFEINHSPKRFQGSRILFVHTGGIFGLYDGTIESHLSTDASFARKVSMWEDKNRAPSKL